MNRACAERSQACGSVSQADWASDDAGDDQKCLAVKALGEISRLASVRAQGDCRADDSLTCPVASDQRRALTTGETGGRGGGRRGSARRQASRHDRRFLGDRRGDGPGLAQARGVISRLAVIASLADGPDRHHRDHGSAGNVVLTAGRPGSIAAAVSSGPVAARSIS